MHQAHQGKKGSVVIESQLASEGKFGNKAAEDTENCEGQEKD